MIGASAAPDLGAMFGVGLTGAPLGHGDGDDQLVGGAEGGTFRVGRTSSSSRAAPTESWASIPTWSATPQVGKHLHVAPIEDSDFYLASTLGAFDLLA